MRDPFADLAIKCHQSALDHGGPAATTTPRCASSSPPPASNTAGRATCRSTSSTRSIPVDVNGINSIAGESYHLLYHEVYGLRTTSLRLTNTYGPRMLIRHNPRQTAIGG